MPGCSPSSPSPSEHSPAAGPGWSSGSEEPVGYPESARAAPAPPGGTACRQRTVNGRMLRATHLGRAHPCPPGFSAPYCSGDPECCPTQRGPLLPLLSLFHVPFLSVLSGFWGWNPGPCAHRQTRPATAASPSPASFPSALLYPPPPHTHRSPNSPAAPAAPSSWPESSSLAPGT